MADSRVPDVLFGRAVNVTTFRENVPTNPTKFTVQATQTSTQVTDLRVQFSVKHSHTKHPNQGNVTITNLSTETRLDFETKPLLVHLSAGYGNDLKFLYSGDLRFGQTKLQGVDWETLLELGDGDCMHRWARVNRSYAAGTSVKQVMRDVAGSMGMALPKNVEDDPALNRSFANGTTSHGPARDELSRLLSPYGYTYSIQNSMLVILRESEVATNAALAIDEDHGMLGTPEFGSPPKSGKPPHVTVKLLLYPELRPGNLVQLTSRVKSGLFRLESVKHSGDTHGDAWFTEVEIKPVEVPKASLPPRTAIVDDIERSRRVIVDNFARAIGTSPVDRTPL